MLQVLYNRNNKAQHLILYLQTFLYIVVNKVMIHPAVEDHINDIGDHEYIKAILGGD